MVYALEQDASVKHVFQGIKWDSIGLNTREKLISKYKECVSMRPAVF